MHFVIVADTFPPFRNSAAIQLRDLVCAFIELGYEITVIVPSAEIKSTWLIEEMYGAKVLRLKASQTKGVCNFRRTIAEGMMPILMWLRFRKSPLSNCKWNGVIWYSPSIFHGYFVRKILESSKCKSYLILRDIFPKWAFDIGVLNHGLAYYFFDSIAKYQYSIADVIGVQSPGNLEFVPIHLKKKKPKLEVLHNWVSDVENNGCSISIENTKLAGRMIFVYAGNMGVAQGMDIAIQLAIKLNKITELGFIFVGRGSETNRLKNIVDSNNISNVLFFDEIDPGEIPGLYCQCAAGLIFLDKRHSTHNIPGKFLTYIQAGIPVFACVNKSNDLISIINDYNVGIAHDSSDIESIAEAVLALAKSCSQLNDYKLNCRKLYEDMFAPEISVRQIVGGLL